jgi:hypothetical protein
VYLNGDLLFIALHVSALITNHQALKNTCRRHIIIIIIVVVVVVVVGRDCSVGIATRYWLDDQRDRIPVEVRFHAPVQTGPGAHPASYTIGTGSLSQGYSGRCVALTTHPHLAQRLKKE